MYTTQLSRDFCFPHDGPSYLWRSWFLSPCTSSTGQLPPSAKRRSSRQIQHPSTLPINQVENALLFLLHGEITDQLCLLPEIKARGKIVETDNQEQAHISQWSHLLKKTSFNKFVYFFLNTCSKFLKGFCLTDFYSLQIQIIGEKKKKGPKKPQTLCNPQQNNCNFSFVQWALSFLRLFRVAICYWNGSTELWSRYLGSQDTGVRPNKR